MANSKFAYVLIFGEEEPALIEDDVTKAAGWLIETIKDLKEQGYIQGWRAVGLLKQVREMPKNFYSFTVPDIGKIAYERRRIEL